MAKHYGWEPGFWRRKLSGHTMGWRELQAWIGAMNRQLQAREVSPDSWANADQDAGWQELRRIRDESR